MTAESPLQARSAITWPCAAVTVGGVDADSGDHRDVRCHVTAPAPSQFVVEFPAQPASDAALLAVVDAAATVLRLSLTVTRKSVTP